MKRLTAFAGLLIAAAACSDSGPSGELSHDYVYNVNDHEFHENTLRDGELVSTEVISAEEYDRESGSTLSAAQLRRSAEMSNCGLEAGDYVIEYSVLADSCDLGPLPSELLTFGGPNVAERVLVAPEGCVDDAMPVGCPASIRRHCELTAASGLISLDITIAIDAPSGSGTATIRGLGSDPAAGAADICASSQRLALERLD